MGDLLEDRRDDRDEAEVPTAGMADVAFLLLIFFLLVTTINVDTGIGMTLPPKLEEEKPPPVKERNLFKILVNTQGELLVDEEPAALGQLRQRVKEFVLNYGEDPQKSASPDDAVISIKTDTKTPYDAYIDVLDEVWMAYREIWNDIARTGTLPQPDGERVLERTYDSYEKYRSSLEPEEDDKIKDAFGAQISIAEPDTE